LEAEASSVVVAASVVVVSVAVEVVVVLVLDPHAQRLSIMTRAISIAMYFFIFLLLY
jgi:hypothetical protein